MSDEERQSIKRFDAMVRQLIAEYIVLKQENEELKRNIESNNSRIDTLSNELSQAKADYNNLKLAKMINISDNDFKDAKMRITKMVRDVNKCISLLSSEIGEAETTDENK